MKIQEQPDYLIFADEAKTGEMQDFPDVARGWGVTIDQTQSKPAMEWMNSVFNRIDKNMLYLLQQGIPEWNSSVLYPVGAVIKYKNKIYIAKLENDNAIPSTNTPKWESLINVQDASTTQKGIVKLNSSTNSDSETEAATPKAVKEVAEKANDALSKESGGEVKGSTDFKGSLKQNGSDVLTKENIASQVIYPSGSEASPPIINANQRIVIPNPFKTMNCLVELEIKPTTGNYEWGTFSGSDDNGQPVYSGIKANKLGNNIVIQTAANYILRPSINDCNPFNITNGQHLTSVYYRVRVTKLGD